MCRGFDQSGIRTRVRPGIFYVFLRVPLMMIGEENIEWGLIRLRM